MKQINYDVVNDLYNQYIQELSKDDVCKLETKVENFSEETKILNKEETVLKYVLIVGILMLIISLSISSLIVPIFMALLLGLGFIRKLILSKKIKVNNIIIDGIESDIKAYKEYSLDNSSTFEMK